MASPTGIEMLRPCTDDQADDLDLATRLVTLLRIGQVPLTTDKGAT